MMVGLMVGVVGCGGDSDTPTGLSEEVTSGEDSDTPTGPSDVVVRGVLKGPDGQTLEIKTEEWDNGNIKVEFQYYRDGGSVIKHGWYKGYSENGSIIDEDIYREGLCVEKCEWSKIFGGDWSGSYSYPIEFQHTIDGGSIIGVLSNDDGSLDPLESWLIKSDGQGVEEWRKAFKIHILDLKQTTDSGYIISGTTLNYRETRLIKINSDGNEEWRKVFCF